MNVCVFDTETTSLTAPFCYNIGYVIINDKGELQVERDLVIKQVWRNKPLFATAIFSNKRDQYVRAMKGRKATLVYYGKAMKIMKKDFKDYNVKSAYAFNSRFDCSVFGFNSNYYKCSNVLDKVQVYDIRPYALSWLANDDYKKFCETHRNERLPNGKYKFLTDSLNYATTAESFYDYLINDSNKNEFHMAMKDSEWESAILLACIAKGAKWNTNYTNRYALQAPRKIHFKVNGKEIFNKGYKTRIEKINKNGELVISLTY